jgi:hypothetical protein
MQSAAGCRRSLARPLSSEEAALRMSATQPPSSSATRSLSSTSDWQMTHDNAAMLRNSQLITHIDALLVTICADAAIEDETPDSQR